MAGRRQHYLPRFLQRPFAFRQKGKHFYVYAHHRAHGVYGANVSELGQELDFYGGPEDTSLDDAITDGERQLSITVNRLNSGEPIDHDQTATLICALGARTKAMRVALTDMMPVFLTAARSHLSDGKLLQAKLTKSLSDPGERRKLIYEHIRKDHGHLNREQQAKFYSLMLPKWKSLVHEHEHRLLAEANSLLIYMLDQMQAQADKIAGKAFLEVLSKGPESPIRAQRMAEEMTFEIWESRPGEYFILGDCGPVADFTDGKPRLALGAIDNEVEMTTTFLPISPTRCIVGHHPSCANTASVAHLNEISASLSHEFFISNQTDDPALPILRQMIGSLAPIATEEEMSRLLKED